MRKAGAVLGLYIAASCGGAGDRFGVDINGGGRGGSGQARGGAGDVLGGEGAVVAGGTSAAGGEIPVVAGATGIGGADSASPEPGAGGQGGGAAEEPVGCSPTTPFGKPTLLFKANATERMSGRFWPDEKSIFFVVDGDIFNAVRTSTVVAFPDGAAIPGVKTVGLEYGPFISKDGKSLYFNASEWGVLRLAQREGVEADFGDPEDVVGLRPYPDAPYLAGDDDVLYYDADDENLAEHHIWRAELTVSGFADNEIQIAENADFKPLSPVVSRDELTMYFAANGSAAGVDIKLVTRESRDVAFGDPQDVPNVNVPGAFNRPTWLSDDRCRLVVESAQTLYLAVKTK